MRNTYTQAKVWLKKQQQSFLSMVSQHQLHRQSRRQKEHKMESKRKGDFNLSTINVAWLLTFGFGLDFAELVFLGFPISDDRVHSFLNNMNQFLMANLLTD